MTTLAIDIEIPNAEDVSITDDTISVDLSDGRTIAVPTAWYPLLVKCDVARKGEVAPYWQGTRNPLENH